MSVNFLKQKPVVRTVKTLCWCTLAMMLSVSSAGAAGKSTDRDLRDLFFGEALFYAGQNDPFAAITRLDVELAQHYALDDPSSDSLSYHREEAELDVADFELSWRMHRKVGRAMQRLLDQSVHQSIRDRAAFRLARIAYTKSSYDTALEILDRINTKAPKALRVQAALLRGQCLIALGRYQQAIKVLQPVQDNPLTRGYGTYNLGIAYLQSGEVVAGFRQLDRVGTQSAMNPAQAALRDKANLTLGFSLLQANESQKARPYLERIQLQGPFSNRALLWVGWSDAAQGRYDEALVPWMMLRKRDITDVAVQEALLAAPYGFGQLKAFGRSAVLYGEAVDRFNREIERVEASITSIREGGFLTAMLRDEAEHDNEWLFELRKLPDAPETRYLRDLMAGHVFNQSYRNYRDLKVLGNNVDHWLGEIPAYRDLLRLRRDYYAPLLSRIDRTYKRLDRRLKAINTERNRIAAQLKRLLRKRDPLALATAGEKQMLRRIRKLDTRIRRLGKQRGVAMLKEKHRRLSGLVYWQVNTEYEKRLSFAHQHLRQLDSLIEQVGATKTRLARARSEAALSYRGYDRALNDLQARLDYLKVKIAGLQAHQGQYMERRAISELQRRAGRLKRYRAKARFAMAENYDRALQVQKRKARTK